MIVGVRNVEHAIVKLNITGIAQSVLVTDAITGLLTCSFKGFDGPVLDVENTDHVIARVGDVEEAMLGVELDGTGRLWLGPGNPARVQGITVTLVPDLEPLATVSIRVIGGYPTNSMITLGVTKSCRLRIDGDGVGECHEGVQKPRISGSPVGSVPVVNVGIRCDDQAGWGPIPERGGCASSESIVYR